MGTLLLRCASSRPESSQEGTACLIVWRPGTQEGVSSCWLESEHPHPNIRNSSISQSFSLGTVELHTPHAQFSKQQVNQEMPAQGSSTPGQLRFWWYSAPQVQHSSLPQCQQPSSQPSENLSVLTPDENVPDSGDSGLLVHLTRHHDLQSPT